MSIVEPDDRGPKMITHSGLAFWPGDPRAEDVRMSDIANHLSCIMRYCGAGGPHHPYTVAEHSAHVAQWIMNHPKALPQEWPREDRNVGTLALLGLLHDAAETYMQDLPTAPKKLAGPHYKRAEARVQRAVNAKYGLSHLAGISVGGAFIKDLDKRIIVNEKAALFTHSSFPWCHDEIEPLPGVNIMCLPPVRALDYFAETYWRICRMRGVKPEDISL